MDTIFALATGSGRAGVAVVRVSGPRARETAQVFGIEDLPVRGMSYQRLLNSDGSVLDDAVVLTFEAPNSFTGEDIVEYQVHGSVAVVTRLIGSLSESGIGRLAEAGEFTRRAMENGRMDLTQVEALADLIEAETEVQRQQAQLALTGGLGRLADNWRTDLIRAAALVEATIDFADEEVPEDVSGEVVGLLQDCLKGFSHEAARVNQAERVRSGFEVAIVGEPNAGKSTLLNALAGREAAITSEIEGTTRDVVEVRMDIGGLPVTILDTAGVRLTEDPVEKLGIERAVQRANAADIRVFLSESPAKLGVPIRQDDIHVFPKADLRDATAGAVSGLTGLGIETLLEEIRQVLVTRVPADGIASRYRHQNAILRAMEAANRALAGIARGPGGYDIVAEEIRTAIRALDALIGKVDVEDLLDEIFSRFCVGK